jgi:acetyltransferase
MQLLTGFRGKPAGDIKAVARTMGALSRFIAEFSDRISEVEINPLAVMEKGQGCIALDCVLIPKEFQQ